jgi:PEP-CTERM motif
MRLGSIAGFVAINALVTAASADSNVALNKPVTIIAGSAQITNLSTPLSVIDDGVFTPESTNYGSAVSESVEWTTIDGQPANGINVPTTLEIDLGGLFAISGAIMQADDNDSYLLQYHDTSTNSWLTLWNVPSVSQGSGFRTRPNADQMTFQPLGPVTTDAVRVSALSGDAALGVSEIQLNGSAVPEPSSTALITLAGLATCFLRRLRQRALTR